MMKLKKVLVLGGTRFFGKHLVEALLQDGHDVTIATRGITEDSFGSAVKRLIVDREDEEQLTEHLKDKSYDIVYDNLCYSSNAANIICEVLEGKTKKYIMTSSMAVYEPALNLSEEDFNPYEYEIAYGDRNDFSYSEGKRLAEAVLFQKATFPVVAVRFPVVIGENDYTKRLQFYVEHIVRQEPVAVNHLDGELSFIHEEEAGQFLAWCGTESIEGPINACSHGVVSTGGIIHFIEENTGIKALLQEVGDHVAPYNEVINCTLYNGKANELGFPFRELKVEIAKVLCYYIRAMK
ncbi:MULTISPECIES: NAD-dependent epimerase/dehydratase family protein [Bacillus]|uniref:UDP-glucose 4-epimerase n=2 Tax=Bacillus cereus group TaxID=86661 RepID=A0A2B0Y874_BACAN|nr:MULTISPECIES: NAD-dependent epimerase/dehydratase family protein [Bacillus]MBJ8060515.1 NAD-dependent epimerase/dehydratase family protein [Bacillus cereus]MCU4757943.1 NAD-dependent epimerase/dehydratase family protein [Bacillus cereus]MCU5108036.1 NAD-dependent epimerase/dehydratase family protein [Bacillus cereus]MCU5340788.1 NAD-dependent epimerase/dehydratase family protein [Bacillus cereus]MDF2017018.1 NAD-dependent epimerase/dehydratase family protein [Bacillus sp. Cr_R3]